MKGALHNKTFINQIRKYINKQSPNDVRYPCCSCGLTKRMSPLNTVDKCIMF